MGHPTFVVRFARAAAPHLRGAAAFVMVAALAAPALAQPQVTARVVPAANRAGWHDGPAVVEFRCREVATCPPAVRVTRAGRQRVSGEARTDAGVAISTATVVDLDMEPPTVSLQGVPEAVTQATLRVQATVSDTLSGVASASCNGAPATIDADRVSCDVALEPGHNEVIVQATDRAGNSGSAGATIARTGMPTMLLPIPQQLTLLVGEAGTIQVADEFGIAHPDAVFTVSDPAVLELVGRSRIAARAPGRAVVAIGWRGLRAAVAVTVAAGAHLELNAQRWAVNSEPGSTLLEVIYTHELAGLESLLLERRASGRVVARGIATVEGLPALQWTQTPAIRLDERIVQTMGETFGGGLLRLESPGGPDAIVRVGRPDRDGGVPLWRLEASGRLGRMVQGWTGMVFALETPPDGFPRVLVIDGRTGRVRARVPFPRSARVRGGCEGAGWPREAAPLVGVPFIPDGREVAIEFATADDDEAALDCRAPVTRERLRITMLHVDGAGAVRTTELAEFVVASGRPMPSAELGYVFPDARGGTLAPFTIVAADGRREHHVVRFDGDERRQYTLPIAGEFTVMDEVQPIYVQSGGSIAAFDPETGEVFWHRRVSDGPVEILAGRIGGGVVARGDGRWIVLDLAGVPVEPDAWLPAADPQRP